MDRHHPRVESKVYQTKEQIIDYLRPFFRQDIDRGVRVVEVYRTPGTFAHEYLSGSLTLRQVLETVRKHPAACFCCMDERVKPEGGITSHRSCGAAAIIADMVQNDEVARAKYEQVVGRETTARLLKAMAAAQGEQLVLAKDAFGAEWSMALASMAGLSETYRHLEVDDNHHYASMAVLDVSGNLMVNTQGEVGERAFFISNPKKIVPAEVKIDREQAYGSLIDYGLLALQIARGAHSSLPHDTTFTIAIVRNERFDVELWNRLWKEKVAVLKASWATAQLKKPIDQRVELNFQVEMLLDADITEPKVAEAR